MSGSAISAPRRAHSVTRRSASSLAELHPALAAEWHRTKNGRLTPYDVTPGIHRKVWWRCPKERSHIWEASIQQRARCGTGCPFCSGNRPSRTTSLRARAPAVAAQWHEWRNARLTPDDVTPGSQRKVWWRCSANPQHVWHAQINAVVRSPHGGCPLCPHYRATPETSLRALFPSIAGDWHPTANGDLRPEDVRARSARRIVWRCLSCWHVWQTAVSHRTVRAHGCPACAGHVASWRTSLRTRFPAIADEWHPTANGELTPEGVLPGSNRRVVWRCSRDPSHVWEAKPATRTRLGTGCPFCAGKVASRETSLAALHPRIAREWDRAKNAPLIPRDVRPGAEAKVWWRCSKDPSHEWRAAVYSRASGGTGCPMCAGKQVTKETSFAALHPRIAREWHPTKNAPLTAREVLPHSNRRVWWRCHKHPSHEWQMRICKRTDGGGCPVCAGRIATPENSLRAGFPELARQWHRAKNLPLTPDDVLPGSTRRVWWRCPRRRTHVWAAIVGNRTRNGSGCPMCAGRIATPETSLRARFPEIARQWHPIKNHPVTSDDVMPGSGKRVWWMCPLNRAHVWPAAVYTRTSGNGCPYCAGMYARTRARRPRR
jgi:Probable Zinc-ribbon domain